MTVHSPVVWIVGDADRAEMRDVHEVLVANLPTVVPRRCRDVAEVDAMITNRASPPDLVLVCQSWSDEFPADHVARLHAAVPLARVVCLSGLWCESVGRTRQHWPPGLRVPIWAAGPRIEHELDILAGRRVAFPWTATREDVLSALVPSPPSAGQRVVERGRARVEIIDVALELTWKGELQHNGWTIIEDVTAPVDIVVLQADPVSDDVREHIATRCRAVAPAAVVAVTAWPLPEWTEQLRGVGVCAVVNALDFNGPIPAFIATRVDNASSGLDLSPLPHSDEGEG